jgi:cystathionine gamma-synthase
MTSSEYRSKLSVDSIVVAAGRPTHDVDGPINVPVVLSSTFHAGGPVAYARTSNPTWEALEEVVGVLEGGTALAFASGMAAISTVMDIIKPGGVVALSAHTYSGAAARMRDLEAAGRVTARLVQIDDPDAIAAACVGADVLWLESPTNPAMEVCDIPAAVKAAHDNGVIVVCDNTFATPINQQPLSMGVDVVVHSATKMLAGHSDVLMGIVVTNDEDIRAKLIRARTLLGGIPGPLEAYLALRGIRTLALRVRQSQASTAILAERLSNHAAVTRVRYPGLSNDPGHAVASRQMKGYGSVLSFETIGDAAAAEKVCDSVTLMTHATSLGGVETLIERRRRWVEERPDIPETLIRLAVGIEDVEDLWADLDGALNTLL